MRKVGNIERGGAGKCRIERDEAKSLGMVPSADRSSRNEAGSQLEDMGIPTFGMPSYSSLLLVVNVGSRRSLTFRIGARNCHRHCLVILGNNIVSFLMHFSISLFHLPIRRIRI